MCTLQQSAGRRARSPKRFRLRPGQSPHKRSDGRWCAIIIRCPVKAGHDKGVKPGMIEGQAGYDKGSGQDELERSDEAQKGVEEVEEPVEDGGGSI